MSRCKFVAYDHIKDFNELKSSLLDKSFTRDSFKDELKKLNIPCSNTFWSGFVKLNIIKRISKTEFVFTDNKPVHFKVLENVYLIYFDKISEYMQKYETKKNQEIQYSQINDAVQLLKSLGFQVFKPVGDLYSKL